MFVRDGTWAGRVGVTQGIDVAFLAPRNSAGSALLLDRAGRLRLASALEQERTRAHPAVAGGISVGSGLGMRETHR